MVDINIFTTKEASTLKPPMFRGKTVADWLLGTEARISDFCRGAILHSFAEDLIGDSNWVLIASINNIPRAFAFLERKSNDTLYLHLICSPFAHAAGRRMLRRSHAVEQALRNRGDGGAGVAILSYLQNSLMGNIPDSPFRRFKRIQLSAIISVITFYHRIGWRFIHRCNGKENPAITEAVVRLNEAMKPIRQLHDTQQGIAQQMDDFIEESGKDPDSAWYKLRALLEHYGFSGATTYPGEHTVYTQTRRAATSEMQGVDYTEADLRKMPTQKEMEEGDMTETREMAQIDTSEHGYEMLWCLPLPLLKLQVSPVAEAAGVGVGGALVAGIAGIAGVAGVAKQNVSAGDAAEQDGGVDNLLYI